MWSGLVSVKEYVGSGCSGLSSITMIGGFDVWVETLCVGTREVWVEAQQVKGEGKEKKSCRRDAKWRECLSAAIGGR